MSIKTFLVKIWAEIETLFDNIPAELKLAAKVAVTVVENIKTVTDSPVIDVLTTIIPGDVDNDIVAVIRHALPTILTDLKLVNEQLTQTGSSAIAAEGIKTIATLSGDIKNAFLHDLGILLAQEIAKAKDHALSWADGVYVIEWYYQHQFKKAN